ncbi:Wadjet anti-phage system protein JetD domain-containing protein [Streptomyces violaceus]|uniref:Wadjet anti-phage system protein JetD domain-containing protein n=1 Tax=Streptomyces violaceus TaxID=1936 RepID=UPI003571344D
MGTPAGSFRRGLRVRGWAWLSAARAAVATQHGAGDRANDVRLACWGDADTHGFTILDRLRRTFAHTQSILMNRPTFLEHRGQWVKEDAPTHRALGTPLLNHVLLLSRKRGHIIPPGGNPNSGQDCSRRFGPRLQDPNQPVAHHNRWDAENGGRVGWTHGGRCWSSSVWSGPGWAACTGWACGWRRRGLPSKPAPSPEASSLASTPCPGSTCAGTRSP